MSGIAGILRLDGAPVDDGTIEALRSGIAHRGPDGVSVHREGPLAVAHALLRATPAAQSFVERPDVSVAGDLRLDEPGDSDVVLAAFERWGDRFAEHLDGDFALVVWDRRRRRLLLARDPFGVKPLVYCHLPGRLFAFASEVGSLLGIAGIPREVDRRRIAEFVTGHPGDFERTFHRALLRLPGGHTLSVDGGRVAATRYWHLERVAPLRLRSDEEYAAGYREHFERAVRANMRVVDPSRLGAMLSGGLDSSAIACFARDDRARSGAGPLRVYRWVFSDALEADERRWQEIVIATGGFLPRTLDSATAGLGPWSGIDELLPGGPPYAPNMYLNAGAAALARADGVNALLDGLGGDSTISRGRAGLAELLVRGRPLALARELRAIARTSETSASTARLFLSLVARPLAPDWLLAAADRVRGRQPHPTLLRPELARLCDPPPRRPLVTARQEHLAQLTAPRLAEGLELFDLVLARHGVEGRYPFFDRRLAEYCLSLPADQKLAGGFSRIVARRAMEGVLPPEVQWRAGKGAPGLHVIPALRASRERMDALLLREPSPLEDFLQMDVLRSTYRDFIGGQISDLGTAVRLWNAAVLAAWLDQLS